MLEGFSENTTPHQQHWANTVQKSPIQPLVHDWLATPENADDVKPSSLKIQREIRAGVNKNTAKYLARLFPARSLHLSAVNDHRSGASELSGP